jgi:hypothetical protein
MKHQKMFSTQFELLVFKMPHHAPRGEPNLIFQFILNPRRSLTPFSSPLRSLPFRNFVFSEITMTSSTIIGFDLIVILSFLFGLLVLGTAIFSSRVHRQPPWYSLMAPLFIYDIVFMLGMGYQVDTGFPAGLCIWQAILLYSIPGW